MTPSSPQLEPPETPARFTGAVHSDLALVKLAKIVHAADVAADIDTSPEGPGLRVIAHGFALLHGADDHGKIALETPMYDALYAWCEHKTGSGA